MKNIFIFFSITLMLISFSCSDKSSINSPLQSDKTDQVYQIIDDEIFLSKEINGDIGGDLTIDTKCVNTSGDTVTIIANLKIDPLAFEGVREIQMIPNFSNATIQFFPEMNFNKKIKLNLLFKGIDLQKLGFTDSSNVRFVYIKDNGDIETVEYSSCNLIGNEKFLKVTGAQLSHFSRYSFIR